MDTQSMAGLFGKARDHSHGMFTPEFVDGRDPEDIAGILNQLVSRVNHDEVRDAKRAARNLAISLFVAGAVFGFVSGVAFLLPLALGMGMSSGG